jgi:hypothetical protein
VDEAWNAKSHQPQGDRSDDKRCLAWLKSSLDECLRDHPTGPTDGGDNWLPTRLLDASMSSCDGGIVRLVDQNENPLAMDRIPRTKYATLSHVWGKTKPLCLTRENHTELRRGLDISLLPALFRDAIELSRGLGIYYVWIDSLW